MFGDPGTLFISIIFGIVGMGYIAYGRRQQKPLPLLIGIALGIYPYFVSNLILMIGVGIGLMVLPYFIES
jgi:hypothetical protein